MNAILPADGVRRGGSGVRACPQSSRCQSPPLSASEDEPLAQAARVSRPRNAGPRPSDPERIGGFLLPGSLAPLGLRAAANTVPEDTAEPPWETTLESES